MLKKGDKVPDTRESESRGVCAERSPRPAVVGFAGRFLASLTREVG